MKVKLPKSFVTVTTFSKLLALFLFIALPIIGFAIGIQYTAAISTEEDTSSTETSSQMQVKALEEELQAVLDDRAQLVSTTKETYNKEEFGLYSPLIEGKEIEVRTYKYKTQTIKAKSIEIDDSTGVVFWEYGEYYYPYEELPELFAIFDGYENYAYHAELISDIQNSWDEKYKTRNGLEMFYGYHAAPKSIGSVSLSAYFRNFPNYTSFKPTFVRIWNTKIENYPQTTGQNDPSVLKAKKGLNDIVDSFEFVMPKEDSNE
ncbi:hypothetical protein KBD81_05390 [Candidatus Woesebacteria bacterium]|nr:hypothetical protein [Candidatus Woesebacteria bacterium]